MMMHAKPGNREEVALPEAALLPRPHARRVSDRILACLATPKLFPDIVRHTRCSPGRVRHHLAALRRRGLVRRFPFGFYAVAAYDGPAPVHPRVPATRDRLQAYLATPRSVTDLARHIHYSEPATARHLAAMQQLGLVQRLARDVYALAAYDGPVPASAREPPIRDRLLAYLATPRLVPDLAWHLGRSAATVSGDLVTLRRLGLVKRLPGGFYALATYDGAVPLHPRVRPVFDQVLAHLATPRSVVDLARHIQCSAPTASHHLAVLRRLGLVKRLGYGVYALAGHDGPMPEPGRPQPIRDRLLAYLATPRLIADIADHIDRPVPTATGHLAAMRRRGLVMRLGWGVYVLAGYHGPVPLHPRAPPAYPGPHLLRDRLQAYLATPRILPDLSRHIVRSEATTREHLAAMRRLGLVKFLGFRVYALAGYDGPPPLNARLKPVRDQVLAYLATPRRVSDVARHIGRSPDTAHSHLATLVRLGLARCVQPGVYVSATQPADNTDDDGLTVDAGAGVAATRDGMGRCGTATAAIGAAAGAFDPGPQADTLALVASHAANARSVRRSQL